jgi:hypothetical protein
VTVHLNTVKSSDLHTSRLWIPDEPPPCVVDPDAWTEQAHLGQGRQPANPLRVLRERTELARKECQLLCPFQVECLEAAMAEEGGRKAEKRYGIRGGLLPIERETLYKRRKRESERAAA